MRKITPLPHEWMLVSIIGFFISIWQVWNIDKTWGFTFAIFFTMMFVASIVSMSQATTDEDHLEELSIHKEHVRKGSHRKKT